MMTIADWVFYLGEDQNALRGRGVTVKLLQPIQFDVFAYQMQMNRLRDLALMDQVPFTSINPPINGKTPPLWDDFTDCAPGLYDFDMRLWCDLLRAEYEAKFYDWHHCGTNVKFMYRRQLNRLRAAQGLPELPITYPE